MEPHARIGFPVDFISWPSCFHPDILCVPAHYDTSSLLSQATEQAKEIILANSNFV